MMVKKLNANEKHFLRLIAKDQQCPSGWAPVSKVVYPLVKAMPPELVEHVPSDEGKGSARLTQRGEAILGAMSWL